MNLFTKVNCDLKFASRVPGISSIQSAPEKSLGFYVYLVFLLSLAIILSDFENQLRILRAEVKRASIILIQILG